jgi:hypothetical protein
VTRIETGQEQISDNFARKYPEQACRQRIGAPISHVPFESIQKEILHSGEPLILRTQTLVLPNQVDPLVLNGLSQGFLAWGSAFAQSKFGDYATLLLQKLRILDPAA